MILNVFNQTRVKEQSYATANTVGYLYLYRVLNVQPAVDLW